jgi:zinc protease
MDAVERRDRGAETDNAAGESNPVPGLRAGGTSLASDAEFVPASVADEVVPAGGVGRFSGVTLDKILSRKAIAVVPFIDELEEGMRGGSTPQDLETMFQLLYLRFTQPRADPTAFAAAASQARALLANQMASPDVVFNQAILAALEVTIRDCGPRRRQPSISGISEIAGVLQGALRGRRQLHVRLRRQLHARFDPAAGRNLPRQPSVDARARNLARPRHHSAAGIVEKTVEKGIAPKSEVALVFSGPFEYDDPHTLALRTMTRFWSRGCSTQSVRSSAVPTASRPIRTSRSFRGRSMSCESTGRAIRRDRRAGTPSVRRDCVPQGQTAVGNANGIHPRESAARFRAEQSGQHYFLNEIARRYKNGDTANLAAISNVPDRIKMLTADELYEAAKTYLDTDRYDEGDPDAGTVETPRECR